MSTPDTRTWQSERARIASLTRSRRPDDPDLIAARERLAYARVEERIRRAVAEAPPLSDEMLDRLRRVIVSSGALDRVTFATDPANPGAVAA